VFQPYGNRLPEWVANTNTENSRWLIEQVMPLEAPSISPTLDTDGDGIPDLLEAINGTYPLEADFADWIAGFSGIGDQTGPGDDPDGDGIPNGVEAWFGTHPGEANAGLILTATDGLVTTLSHPQNEIPLADVVGHYEWSPDLVEWYAGDGVDGPPGGPSLVIASQTTGATTAVTATASEPMERVFLRIRASIDINTTP